VHLDTGESAVDQLWRPEEVQDVGSQDVEAPEQCGGRVAGDEVRADRQSGRSDLHHR
jgi:hypothetical protein